MTRLVRNLARNSAERDDAHNDEILTLLQQVSGRLVHNEKERKALKAVMEDLAEKSDQGERAYLTIHDRLNKATSLLEKRQDMMEKAQEAQEQRLEQTIAMTQKIEEALTQYARINRRLDKVAQDKARMIRKLERIEEAVTETRSALDTKGLALAVPQNTLKDIVTQTPANNNTGDDRPLWQQHAPVRIAAVMAMIMLGVFGGWTISNIQNGAFNLSVAELVSPLTPPQKMAFNKSDDAGETGTFPSFPASDDYNREDVAEEESLPQDILASDLPEETEPEKSPLEMNDEQLLASFEENPDALAARLNDISPVAAATLIDKTHKEKTSASDAVKPQQASLTPAEESVVKAPVKEDSSAAFLKEQTDSRLLRERMKADTSLPPVMHEVEIKAFEGIAEAQHDLAAIYTTGHGGVTIDYTKAAFWFRESALKGVANARYNLGVLYHQGLGVEKNIEMAVKWYRAAAETGHPEAQYNLAIAYIEGIGTDYNPEKAAYYFEQAADKGVMEAAYNLGLIYENGLTGASKPEDALYWYKKATDLGSPEAKVAMNQLVKVLGLAPEEIENFYSGIKKNKKVETNQTQPKEKTASLSEKKRGVEYIEALPLEEPPALATIEENNNNKLSENNQALVAQIQEQLIRIGLYPGPADGVADTLTEDAIRAYQTNFNLKPDGHAGQALLVHMMTSDFGSSTEYGSRME